MAQQIFINVHVKDMDKAKAFYEKVGYTFNPQFTNKDGACMVISDTIFVMLLTHPFMKNFTEKEISDAHKTTEAILCLSAESRDAVDDVVNKAVAAGGKATTSQDHGWMYERGYQDLDGHLWEIAFMDMANAPKQP